MTGVQTCALPIYVTVGQSPHVVADQRERDVAVLQLDVGMVPGQLGLLSDALHEGQRRDEVGGAEVRAEPSEDDAPGGPGERVLDLTGRQISHDSHCRT